MDDAWLASRPRLRGRLHLAAAALSVGGLVWLVTEASTGAAAVAAWIYGLAGIGLYLTSGTYHVFTRTERARRIMQRAVEDSLDELGMRCSTRPDLENATREHETGTHPETDGGTTSVGDSRSVLATDLVAYASEREHTRGHKR